ncbi:CRN2-like protein [Phytophthora cinnamomi]|uniref:CRN2-like protein n=1 Tax=Phytophthora cinnamomi TaxID=4785 RepID=UPI0035595CC1|nr:CRN2-like protein [Phytophthora cinnamomi]
MGATNAVAYSQGVVEEICGDLLGNGILGWLDDILGYAEDATALMEVLDNVLARCEKYGLKLHAKKRQFFATEVKCCGKLNSDQGVRHCPERVQGLIDMPLPRTDGELQQFLCAINWVRQGIPEDSRLTDHLYAFVELSIALSGSRNKLKLHRSLLVDAGLSEKDTTCLNAVCDALLNMILLAHPSPVTVVCLYADASQDFRGAVVTQIDPNELQLPLEKQNHRPLAFLSGRFADASGR